MRCEIYKEKYYYCYMGGITKLGLGVMGWIKITILRLIDKKYKK